jgi:hypothetical protein
MDLTWVSVNVEIYTSSIPGSKKHKKWLAGRDLKLYGILQILLIPWFSE